MPISFLLNVQCPNPNCPVDVFSEDITDQHAPDNFSGAFIIPPGALLGQCPTCSTASRATGEILTFFRGQLERTDSYGEMQNAWNIRFTHCITDSQEYGSDSEHMNSKVFFQAARVNDADRVWIIQSSCIVRQDQGESFTFETMPFNVENPTELIGQINYGEFRDAVERYFRLLIGPEGVAFRIGQNVTNLRIGSQQMFHNHFAVVRNSGEVSSPW
ncbi:MAG: hypothetical protein ACRYFR_04225 [Janthinobacterium lividum]